MRNTTPPISAIVLLLFAALAMLAVTREVLVRLSTEPLGAPHSHGMKGDVKRGSDGRLWYSDGQAWTTTPPRPDDVPF
ncbi:MAG TPA: hypothetical protein VFP91_14145 [Vicinamibacterales bacterium]|nr:hypothetical protein [Vicinamibacterales bacterium]